MLSNISPVEELRALARRRGQSQEFKSVTPAQVTEYEADGWTVAKKGKKTVRLARAKRRSEFFEDRVWHLLYRMGFSHLSAGGGAHIEAKENGSKVVKRQIDVVALDPEVAVAIECKSSDSSNQNIDLRKEIVWFARLKSEFAKCVHSQFPLGSKRIPLFMLFTWGLKITEVHRELAEKERVVLVDETDLRYYEQLTDHLKQAAKCQLFSDVLAGHEVHALQLDVPAIRTRMGKHTCYTFSVRPDYLLKISYVSHRAKGKAAEIDTYQRMVNRSRLKQIREYISQEGIFPTNIVVNLDGRRHRFDPKEKPTGTQGGEYGILRLRPSYGEAWVIDGQHRLLAYADHPFANRSFVHVLAFERLSPSKQAQLFIDINHEQKSVKRSLLQELYAELNWDADDQEKRVSAVVSKAIQILDDDADSPIRGRVLLADDRRSAIRCISLSALFGSLLQPGIFIVKKDVEYGPLWGGTNERTMARTVAVVKSWLAAIRTGNEEWWDLGSGEGGGLAMNDGVTVCLGVLKSVLAHLSSKLPVLRLTDDELVRELMPFALGLGKYFSEFSIERRDAFRRGARGVQGQTAQRRECELALNEMIPEFCPPGIEEAKSLKSAKTNSQAYEIIRRIETALSQYVLDTVKAEFGVDEAGWWYTSIPQSVRRKIDDRRDEEQGKLSRESYFDLMDFRDVILANWQLFGSTLGYEKSGNKEKRTSWLVKINQLRNIVMHPSKNVLITLEQLDLLANYDQWLQQSLVDESLDDPDSDTEQRNPPEE